MVLDLLQAGLRTAYRALGADEVRHETDRASVHAFAFPGGRGAPIVFLHGLGDASTTWLRSVQALRDRHALYMLDVPPFGLSELHREPWLRPRDQAAEVHRFLEAHLEPPVVLVGQSMGGWTAQWLLHDHPDWFQQAVLVSPAGVPLPGSVRAVALLTPCTPQDVVALWNAMWFRAPPIAKAVPGTVLERFHRPAFRGFLHNVSARDMLNEDQLGSIGVEALVLWGRKDRILDQHTPAFLAQHWGAPVQRSYLARAAHLPHLERPRAVVRRVRDVVD